MTRYTYRPKKTYLEASKEFKSVDIRQQHANSSQNASKKSTTADSMQKICFACRKPGHSATKCPILKKKSNRSSGNLCFYCGSKEHSLSKCLFYKKGDALKYAQCFVCNESGHLAGQCPSNENGIYPNGGACRHCSLKDHLAKDCPSMAKKTISKSTSSKEVLLDTIRMDQGGDDDIYHDSVKSESKHFGEISSSNSIKKPKKKVVTF